MWILTVIPNRTIDLLKARELPLQVIQGNDLAVQVDPPCSIDLHLRDFSDLLLSKEDGGFGRRGRLGTGGLLYQFRAGGEPTQGLSDNSTLDEVAHFRSLRAPTHWRPTS